MNCSNCQKETKNPKFCSRSCSTSFNNKIENGRKVGKITINKKCKVCENQIKWNQVRCNNCKLKIKTLNGNYVDADEITKDELSTKDTQKNRRIREHARKIAKKEGLLKECIVCGYFIHVECCHKKAIKDFEGNALISAINNPKNLQGMCRNHHWEHDNLITLT